MSIPLRRARNILVHLVARELADRVFVIRLALIAKPTFDDKSARQQQELLDELVPERYAEADSEQAALDLLEQLGHSPVRRRKHPDQPG